MKIGKYISELLYSHETVILPGFGSFSTRYVPAKFVSEKNIVEAPAKVVDFSPEPKEGFTPLTALIAEREGMTEDAVNDFFRKLAPEINQSLQEGQKVQLEKIGLFQMDEKGEIQFSHDKSVNYLNEDTGVSHIKAPAFSPPEAPPAEKDQPADGDAGATDDKPADETADKTADQPADQPAGEPAGEHADHPADESAGSTPDKAEGESAGEQTEKAADTAASATDNKPAGEKAGEPTPPPQTANEPKDDAKRSGGFQWLFYIGIPLLVILLILLLRFDYFFGGEGVFRTQETVEQIEPVPSEPADPPATDEPEEEIAEPEPAPTDPDIEPPAPEAGRPVYYIVVGSFRNESEAHKLARQLRAEGANLASVFMQTPAEYHRVCYGYYYDLDEAKDQKATLDGELRDKAWILHR